MKFFFSTDDNGAIRLRARLESDEMVGHFNNTLPAGTAFYGLPYALLKRLGHGMIEVDDQGHARVTEEAA